MLGHNASVCDAQWPVANESLMADNTFTCPVSFNGKTRFTIELPLNTPTNEVEQMVLNNEQTSKYTEGKQIKRIIIVPNKIVNVVVG